ncbi:UDP-2,3-diacylglucosamine diphosphatase LpxI [Mesorhizobium sp. WSM2239]|uniref:UDP-2,3-diacylglucosamine diphosphatase LpxI n=2 Tax=unclassified Mesorhizobium TaxID=325217 RepID=A0AAU8D2F6_9HYPH
MTRADAEPRNKLAAGDRVAVVAGSGRLPVTIAKSLAEAGHSPFVVMLAGEAGDDLALASFEHEWLALEEIGALLPLLKHRKITHVVLAGGVSRRPHWRQIRPTLALLRILPRILMALARGDDGLLRVIIGQIEAEGFKVIGAHEVVPDLLAPEGLMTRARPMKGDAADLDAALAAARAIGALDIGQAAVAIGGRVVALEGVEGTDGLLERVKELRHHGRIGGRKRGVLVKCAKPGQELRADLPGIGPATVDAAHAAGLAGIGVEAGHSLVLDFGETVKRADALGLFVVGLPAGGKP